MVCHAFVDPLLRQGTLDHHDESMQNLQPPGDSGLTWSPALWHALPV